MSLAEDKGEDASSISSSSSEYSDEDDVESIDYEQPPPAKKKRLRDKIGPQHDMPSFSRDPYEELHRQMTSEADQLKKLKEKCE